MKDYNNLHVIDKYRVKRAFQTCCYIASGDGMQIILLNEERDLPAFHNSNAS